MHLTSKFLQLRAEAWTWIAEGDVTNHFAMAVTTTKQRNYSQTPSPHVPRRPLAGGRPSHPVGELGYLLYGGFLLVSMRTCMSWEGTASSFPRTVNKASILVPCVVHQVWWGVCKCPYGTGTRTVKECWRDRGGVRWGADTLALGGWGSDLGF